MDPFPMDPFPMDPFDPARDVENAAAILDAAGRWPSFHDAILNAVSFDRGDIRPDADLWEMARVDAELTLAALEAPYDVRLRFHDCSGLSLEIGGSFATPDIRELAFTREARGTLRDGVTPLTPYIHVRFMEGAGAAMALTCFRVEAFRLPGPPRPW